MKKIIIFSLMFLLLIGIVKAEEQYMYGIPLELWNQMDSWSQYQVRTNMDGLFSVFSSVDLPSFTTLFSTYQFTNSLTASQCKTKETTCFDYNGIKGKLVNCDTLSLHSTVCKCEFRSYSNGRCPTGTVDYGTGQLTCTPQTEINKRCKSDLNYRYFDNRLCSSSGQLGNPIEAKVKCASGSTCQGGSCVTSGTTSGGTCTQQWSNQKYCQGDKIMDWWVGSDCSMTIKIVEDCTGKGGCDTNTKTCKSTLSCKTSPPYGPYKCTGNKITSTEYLGNINGQCKSREITVDDCGYGGLTCKEPLDQNNPKCYGEVITPPSGGTLGLGTLCSSNEECESGCCFDVDGDWNPWKVCASECIGIIPPSPGCTNSCEGDNLIEDCPEQTSTTWCEFGCDSSTLNCKLAPLVCTEGQKWYGDCQDNQGQVTQIITSYCQNNKIIETGNSCANAPNNTCKAGEAQCSDGRCVSSSELCEGGEGVATQVSLTEKDLTEATSSTIVKSICKVDENCLPYESTSETTEKFTVKCKKTALLEQKIDEAVKEDCSKLSWNYFKGAFGINLATCGTGLLLSVPTGGVSFVAGCLVAPVATLAITGGALAYEAGCELSKTSGDNGLCIATSSATGIDWNEEKCLAGFCFPLWQWIAGVVVLLVLLYFLKGGK